MFLTLLDTLRNGSFWNSSLDCERGERESGSFPPQLSDLPKGEVIGLGLEPYLAGRTVPLLFS